MARKNPQGNDTVTVDGVDRTVFNSLGKRIHPTDDGVRNFWRWFGESRVVDAKGRPLVVYHGTNATFDTFNLGSPTTSGRALGPGIYLTNNDKIAIGYGAHVLELYFSAKNPKLSSKKKTITKANIINVVNDLMKIDSDFLSNYGDIQYEGWRVVMARAIDDIYSCSKTDSDVIGSLVNVGGVPVVAVMESIIKRTGKDGFIVNADIVSHGATKEDLVLVALLPTQVKSATGNRGTFDPSDPVMINPMMSLKPRSRVPRRLLPALRRGAKVEMEHTRSKRTAEAIASHHLAEFGARYYPALERMERGLAKKNPDINNLEKDGGHILNYLQSVLSAMEMKGKRKLFSASFGGLDINAFRYKVGKGEGIVWIGTEPGSLSPADAGGLLFRQPYGWRVSIAAVRPAFQGRGIYPFVLRKLSEAVPRGHEIRTGTDFSEGARKAWGKVGATEVFDLYGAGQMRLKRKNPKAGNTGTEFKHKYAIDLLHQAMVEFNGKHIRRAAAEDLAEKAFQYLVIEYQRAIGKIVPVSEYPMMRVQAALLAAKHLSDGLIPGQAKGPRLLPRRKNPVVGGKSKFTHGKIRWKRLLATDEELDAPLDGTSRWPMNTYGGSKYVLYGEMLHGDVIIGRALLGFDRAGDTVEIDKIWTHPSYRRMGIATAMTQEGVLKLKGASVYAPNTTAAGERFMDSIQP